MSAKRVTDVSGEYGDEGARPAKDADIARIRRSAVALKTGRLEKDVDALLASKGLGLDEPLGGGRASAAKPARKKRLRRRR